jgi:hypothetical protein
MNPHMAELTALRARIAQIEAGIQQQPTQATRNLQVQPPVLHANPEAVELARRAVAASKDAEKKLSLPDIVPGFKASSLNIHKSFVLVFIRLLPAHSTCLKGQIFFFSFFFSFSQAAGSQFSHGKQPASPIIWLKAYSFMAWPAGPFLSPTSTSYLTAR